LKKNKLKGNSNKIYSNSITITMPLILEVIFGIFGVAIGGTCYANRKK
jgi:hypothetical protein